MWQLWERKEARQQLRVAAEDCIKKLELVETHLPLQLGRDAVRDARRGHHAHEKQREHR